MRLKWLGHAAWQIDFGSKKVLMDPFITGNPSCPVKPEDLTKIDYIFVTHNHKDHLGDAVLISNNTGAKVVSMFENINDMRGSGLRSENGIGMNKGSGLVDLGGIKAALVDAIHSGMECGVVIECEGQRLYHAGDTAFFSDISLIKRFFGPIDVALLPIGGYFTMGPLQAVEAAKAIGARVTLPMHYNTFPQIRQNPNAFKEALSGITDVIVMKPGDEREI